MEYTGTIGNVHVLDFGSKELFDEAQENPYLLGNDSFPAMTPFHVSSHSPTRNSSSIGMASPAKSELPLDDEASSYSFRDFNKNARAFPTPGKPLMMQQQQQQLQQPFHCHSFAGAFSSSSAYSPANRSINFKLDLNKNTQQAPQMKRQVSTESDASTAVSVENDSEMDLYDSEIHKLLYSLNRFGLANNNESGSASTDKKSQQQQPYHHPTYQDARSSTEYSSNSLWIPVSNNSSSNYVTSPPPAPMTSPTNGARPQRRRLRRKRRACKNRLQNASRGTESSRRKMNRDIDTSASISSMAACRGSITSAAVRNCLRGGGGISRVVTRPNTIVEARRNSTETISSRLKRRQNTFKKKPGTKCRLTDACRRISNMKLGTSPMKSSIKHLAFPQNWTPPMTRKLQLRDEEEHNDDLPGSPNSAKHELRRDSLIDMETLDKIGTRAACPVHLIEEKLTDYSRVLPRVDSHNKLSTPDKTLRRPSAWILGAVSNTTQTSTTVPYKLGT